MLHNKQRKASAGHLPLLFLIALSGMLSFSHLLATPATVPIYAIQGIGESTPMAGRTVTTEGTVVGDFQRSDELSGFFLQDLEGDGNELTSDGIFVYMPPQNKWSKFDVEVGQRLRVTGRAVEFNGQTQLDFISEIYVINAVPAPSLKAVDLSFPLDSPNDLERYEGMQVKIAEEMVVTGNYNLYRHGELELAAGERLFASTNGNGYSKEENARRRLVLDDGSTRREPRPTPHLNEDPTRRVGDSVSGVTGILSFAFDKYRLQPTAKLTFKAGNPRPEKPVLPPGGLTVASFNVQNYFTTLKSQSKAARGAATAEEFESRSAKVTRALREMDADIVGLMEIENNGEVAIGDLVKRLNALYSNEEYTFVRDPRSGTGTDAIKCGFIYKAAKIKVEGEPLSDPQKTYSRLPVAQTFAAPGGLRLTVVVNHFKSKGGCPVTGDVDEGQGCWNGKRTREAEALLGFIDRLKVSSGSNDVVVLGDLNSYMQEAPIKTLQQGGLANLNEQIPAQQRYSSQFQGESGFLDYMLVTASLRPQVAGVAVWHINSDEPVSIAAEGTPYRSSDHDPLIISLRPQNVTAFSVN